MINRRITKLIGKNKEIEPKKKGEEYKVFSGDGITTIFCWPHKLKRQVTMISVRPGSPNVWDSTFNIDWDDTNIIVTFEKPPPVGYNNISFYYSID